MISSVVFRGTHRFGKSEEAAQRDLNVVAADTTDYGVSYETERVGDDPQPDDTETGELEKEEGLPWTVSAAFSYSKAQIGATSSTLNINAGFSLTRNWRFTYRTTYDLEGRDLLGQFISIARDLHCWEISFNRQELVGGEWNFYFKISLKDHPEIYAEQGDRGLGGSRFGSPFRY
jgi:lipopolysaccharide assembly outer membrane protein LptD (OstA)